MDETLAIGDEVGGTWRMITETGTNYLFDLAKMTVVRECPGAPLRRDGEELVLWSLTCAEVGKPAVMWISVRSDGIQTLRVTSVVTELSHEQ